MRSWVTQGVLRFEAGDTEKEVMIPIVDDDMSEPDVTFQVVLSDLKGANTFFVQVRGRARGHARAARAVCAACAACRRTGWVGGRAGAAACCWRCALRTCQPTRGSTKSPFRPADAVRRRRCL